MYIINEETYQDSREAANALVTLAEVQPENLNVIVNTERDKFALVCTLRSMLVADSDNAAISAAYEAILKSMPTVTCEV